MKKKIAVVAIVAGLGLAGLNQAYAGWGARGGNNWNCPVYPGGQYNQTDPAAQEKFDTFFESTQDIRKEMVMKQAEKQAIMRSDNPDAAALSKVTGELFDLRSTMRKKADEAGVKELMASRTGRNPGPGMGWSGRGGRNMGNMMNNPGYGPRQGGNAMGWSGRGSRNMGNMMNNPGYGPGQF